VTIQYKSREQQRQEDLAGKMAFVGLEAHLRNMVRGALEGDRESLDEFQQACQYAPPEMKARLVDFISGFSPGVSGV